MKKIIMSKRKLLRQFGIVVTDDIIEEMTKRSENEIQLDNYCHDLIAKHLK